MDIGRRYVKQTHYILHRSVDESIIKEVVSSFLKALVVISLRAGYKVCSSYINGLTF